MYPVVYRLENLLAIKFDRSIFLFDYLITSVIYLFCLVFYIACVNCDYCEFLERHVISEIQLFQVAEILLISR